MFGYIYIYIYIYILYSKKSAQWSMDKLIYRAIMQNKCKNYSNFFSTLNFMYFAIFRQMSDVIVSIPR